MTCYRVWPFLITACTRQAAIRGARESLRRKLSRDRVHGFLHNLSRPTSRSRTHHKIYQLSNFICPNTRANEEAVSAARYVMRTSRRDTVSVKGVSSCKRVSKRQHTARKRVERSEQARRIVWVSGREWIAGMERRLCGVAAAIPNRESATAIQRQAKLSQFHTIHVGVRLRRALERSARLSIARLTSVRPVRRVSRAKMCSMSYIHRICTDERIAQTSELSCHVHINSNAMDEFLEDQPRRRDAVPGRSVGAAMK